MVLSSMQLQKVFVTLWFRRLQCRVLRSVLSVFINLRSAECVCSYYGLRVSYKQINQIKLKNFEKQGITYELLLGKFLAWRYYLVYCTATGV